MLNNKTVDVAIIGSGPAGIASAIQLNRYGIKSLLLFDKKEHSSLLLNARMTENYLGFPDGISGIDLWHKFYTQLINNNIKQIFNYVDSLDFIESEQLFIITAGKNTYHAKYVIIASGTNPKKMDLTNNNIYYEITKIITKTVKDIAIIGAGDAAFDYALSMAKANNVSIFNRGTNINALSVLQEQVNLCNHIKYYDNTKVINLNSTNSKKQRLVLQHIDDSLELDFDYIIAAIGRIANKDFYSNNIRLLESILIKNKLLYLVGDVKNNIYRQVAIAVADGILAAMQLQECLF